MLTLAWDCNACLERPWHRSAHAAPVLNLPEPTSALAPRACIVGHSYGTFVGSRLVQQHRDRVHTLCLIDPVCFGMFMPHLLHNFIVSFWRGGL